MDIDFSGLWSWTVPLWGLFILVLFLVGVLNTPVVIEEISAATMVGGARKRHVRFTI
jgi:hypothetical protein